MPFLSSWFAAQDVGRLIISAEHALIELLAASPFASSGWIYAPYLVSITRSLRYELREESFCVKDGSRCTGFGSLRFPSASWSAIQRLRIREKGATELDK